MNYLFGKWHFLKSFQSGKSFQSPCNQMHWMKADGINYWDLPWGFSSSASTAGTPRVPELNNHAAAHGVRFTFKTPSLWQCLSSYPFFSNPRQHLTPSSPCLTPSPLPPHSHFSLLTIRTSDDRIFALWRQSIKDNFPGNPVGLVLWRFTQTQGNSRFSFFFSFFLFFLFLRVVFWSTAF